MKLSRSILNGAKTLFFVLPLVLSSAEALADEKPKPAAAPATAAPGQDEMMKAWMAQATAGPAHKAMEAAVGSWDVKTKAWMAPGAPPSESAGTSENKMILGGRFLEQRYEGTMMGQPFSGIGVTGYDNYKKKVVATWIDSMSTAIMVMHGSWDKSRKVLTSYGTMDDVVSKKPMKMKSKVTIVDADHHTYESWHTGSDGKWSQDLEIHYTRKK
ncbi:MAG: DUF1579 domain-containing protein [Thermoanaerobaculia bacterium]